MGKTKWVPVPGYEKWYDINRLGHIRSYHTWKGKYDRTIKPTLLLPQYSPTFAYWYISLSRGIGVTKTHSIHILVAKSFVPNPYNRRFVHHKNNDKNDFRAVNLKWVTPGENQELAYADGQRKRPNGVLNGRCKLSEQQVLEIFTSNENHYKLASLYGVGRRAISSIKNGNLWSSVTGKVATSKNPVKQLTQVQILDILNSSDDQRVIASRYGISQSRVSSIKTGRSQSKITGVKFTGKREYEYYGIKSSVGHKKTA